MRENHSTVFPPVRDHPVFHNPPGRVPRANSQTALKTRLRPSPCAARKMGSIFRLKLHDKKMPARAAGALAVRRITLNTGPALLSPDRIPKRPPPANPPSSPPAPTGKAATAARRPCAAPSEARAKRACRETNNGTGGGTRTPTARRPADFKSAASTNSATPANSRVLTLARIF